MVSGHGPQDHRAPGLYVLVGEQRFEEVQPGVHGPRSEEHVGQEDLVGLELPPDNRHSGQKTVVEDDRGRQLCLDCLLDQHSNVIVQSDLEIVGYSFEQVHSISLWAVAGPVIRAMRSRHSKVSHPEQHV